MGGGEGFEPEKLVIAALLSDPSLVQSLRSAVEARVGAVESVRPIEPYTWTRYYDTEMGGGIVRTLFAIRPLQDPSRLASIKILTGAIERSFAVAGSRRVNLDPGLLSRTRFVLASTKASPHRIPLSQGIHAEIELIWSHGEYRPLAWTYPDWASPAYRAWLVALRARYVGELHAHARRAKGTLHTS